MSFWGPKFHKISVPFEDKKRETLFCNIDLQGTFHKNLKSEIFPQKYNRKFCDFAQFQNKKQNLKRHIYCNSSFDNFCINSVQICNFASITLPFYSENLKESQDFVLSYSFLQNLSQKNLKYCNKFMAKYTYTVFVFLVLNFTSSKNKANLKNNILTSILTVFMSISFKFIISSCYKWPSA